ncbi:uncharacterized protein LOC130548231 isoform X2 [Triplophysa rosa]|uniref:uncharacterized protein LOC130548066 isoform X2 n=1 Tax=Triplophysa rosa TaxID=992332 RepID=UPI002545C599|nr:uncharacterized protein LOC130548066 isoform X2 [Triplophysa rosa]XP_057180864.1 uncharacterized protein LOC130548231 isoform X2 [Triplophysa rosa]
MLSGMDVNALRVICALFLSEKRKTRKKRLWQKHWRHGEQELCVLQKEIEVHENSWFMTAGEFDDLLQLVSPLITKRDTKMRRAITARERLSLTLRFLITGRCIYCCLTATPDTEDDWRRIAKRFEERWQFPHCVGALDAKHIHIQASAKNACPSQNFIMMSAAVDADLKFIYADVGSRASESDAGVFVQSDLCRAMDQNLLRLPPPEPLPETNKAMPYVFVGDASYPLRCDLMRPYPQKDMDHGRRVFNDRVSRARSVVQNAFGILANRFRVFRSTICLEPEKVVKITMAALCVHNFLLERRSDAYTPAEFTDWEDSDHTVVKGAWRRYGTGVFKPLNSGNIRNPCFSAKEQRNVLRNYFTSPAGRLSWQEHLNSQTPKDF